MDKIEFKPLDEEHLEWTRLLHNDPEVLGVLTDSREVSEDKQKKWFSDIQQSESSERLIVFYEEQPIGIIRLDQIDYNNRSVRVGLDIHKDYRGKGFAKPIYKKLFDIWFIEKGFNRLWFFVAEYNERAISLYRKLGFKEEGIQIEALLKNGVFYDYIMMSILRREYDNTTL